MAKKGAENTKKAAGNAKKAESANKKKQAKLEAAEAAEASEWDKGSKKANAKKEEEKLKREEAARKKAERELLLKAEEAALPSKPQTAKHRGAAKVAAKRTGKIDDFLGGKSGDEVEELSASGIESALEALALTKKDAGLTNKDIDRHPERRVKAAFAAYEDKRLPEIRKEHPGLRLQQIKNLLFKEFQKLSANPMNQDTNIDYNATLAEIDQKKQEVRANREGKFA